jgi:hypothetical protein
MRKALATVLLTVGLTAVISLPLGGWELTLASAQAGPTTVLVAALFSIAVGIGLFVQVDRKAKTRVRVLARLAQFQGEARAYWERAITITDDKDTSPLAKETTDWQLEVAEWFERELPLYKNTFLSRGLPVANTYEFRGAAVPPRANSIAVWAQERASVLSEIIASVASQEPD